MINFNSSPFSDYDSRPWTFDFLSDLGRNKENSFPGAKSKKPSGRQPVEIHWQCNCLPLPDLWKLKQRERGEERRGEKADHHRQKTRLLNEIPLTLFQSTSSPPWFPRKVPGRWAGRMTGTTCFLLPSFTTWLTNLCIYSPRIPLFFNEFSSLRSAANDFSRSNSLKLYVVSLFLFLKKKSKIISQPSRSFYILIQNVHYSNCVCKKFLDWKELLAFFPSNYSWKISFPPPLPRINSTNSK